MQYKMQFTVLDDAVKQNRKLPEIAFFDTDGNLIHLGGGGEGGDVDLLHLTELGFGEESDVSLERSSGFYGSLNIVAPGGIIYNDPSAPGVPDQPWTQPAVNLASDTGFGSYLWLVNDTGHEHLAALYFGIGVEADYRFKMDLDGAMHWGDGTNAPDVTLERFNQGSVQLVGNGEWDYTDFIIGKSNFSGDHANLEMYADAEEAYLVVTYPAGSDLSNDILYAHMYGEPARYRVHLDGSMHWGGGTAQPDTHLKRTAPGTLEIDHTLSFKGDASDPLSGATITWDQDEYGLTVEGLPGSGGTWFQVKNPDYVEAAYVSSGSIWVGGPYGGEVAASGGNRAAKLYAESEGAGLRVMGTVGIPDASEFPIIGTLCFPHIGGSNDYGWSVPFTIDFNGAIRWSDPTNYTADQDPFSHTTDVTLQRAAAGVLEIPQHGGGFKLTSPDGSQTKTVRLSNAGALELV